MFLHSNKRFSREISKNNNMTGSDPKPAGYNWFIEKYALEVIPNWHASSISGTSIRQKVMTEGRVDELFPARQWPGEGDINHLEFALKYDGINLQILYEIFRVINPDELILEIDCKPYGKNIRRIWYLYELLTGRQLPLRGLDIGGYVDLLDADRYFTNSRPNRSTRQRINDNMLGDRSFCPMIRRTSILNELVTEDLAGSCRAVYAGHSPEVISRAMSFLYTRETKSSFALENIEVGADRAGRFIAQLRRAEMEDFCNKQRFIELQGQIVDSRFAAADYRDFQNYVGESIGWQADDLVHYIPPPPGILDELMDGLERCHLLMTKGNVHPLIHAGVVSFAFVYNHPFEDGNGRIHRFLIHNILALRGFTERGFIFPVSVAMLSRRDEYDAALELLSKSLMNLIDYDFRDKEQIEGTDEQGYRERELVVNEFRSAWYSYPDLTGQVEALGRFIKLTIETDLAEELRFLVGYDKARKAVQEIVDLPDRKLDLFIRLCREKAGNLSRNKRRRLFAELTDEEVLAMEAAVREGFNLADQDILPK